MEKVSLDVHQRDILLMPFPYSDLSGKKVCPVIVVSNDTFNSSSQDLIVCGITSNISKDYYTTLLKKDCLEKGSLLDDCCIKVENIAKIDRSLVIKKIGSLKNNIFSDVVQKLNILFD